MQTRCKVEPTYGGNVFLQQLCKKVFHKSTPYQKISLSLSFKKAVLFAFSCKKTE